LPDWRRGVPAIQIDVVDTGIGISEETLANLFQPFSQADSSVSRKYGGTGLGLAISRHLTELLGGVLQAKSTPNQGSCFTLIMPTGDLRDVRMWRRRGESALEHSRQEESPSETFLDVNLSGVRILLAEDGIDNQRLINAILSRAGASVENVENGKLAVAQVESQHEPYDVILMDMNMPEMDGFEATRLLRSHGYKGFVIALTAYAMADDCKACLDAGCDEYLAKPINRAMLLQTIFRYTRKSASTL
jgi:ammonium transporter, Amt family